MAHSLEDQIIESRRLLQDPYAHLGGEGGYSAAEPAKDGRIAESRILLGDPYAHLDGDGRYNATLPTAGSQEFRINVDEIRSSGIVGKRVSFEKIEEIARSLHTKIWLNRKQLLKDAAADDPVAILDPAATFGTIGYRFEVSDKLGQFMTDQGIVECAGFIDRLDMYAGVSSQLPLPVRNFTAAHELGHALLHDAAGMHRDRALDGGSVPGIRERVEVEADKFATFFLMPEKLVRTEFQKRFSTEQFHISDDTAFQLINDSQDALRSECKNLGSLAHKLAKANHYGGEFFKPLSERFSVSRETMSIRLEELKLIQD